MLITLDSSQAKGVHEKALLAADQKYNLAAYNTHFVIGESATHQISHTKGFVADGRVAAEGSTNWSTSGEGTFVVNGKPGGAGYVGSTLVPMLLEQIQHGRKAVLERHSAPRRPETLGHVDRRERRRMKLRVQ